jgi:uncharacterized protein (DUF433 family)
MTIEAKIIKEGRNPRIAGTRISVYAIVEYLQSDWRPDDIAFWLNLKREQVDAAICYINDHKEEVMAEYEKIMERINRGNPSELQAKLDAGHARFQAMIRDRLRSRGQEIHHEWNEELRGAGRLYSP